VRPSGSLGRIGAGRGLVWRGARVGITGFHARHPTRWGGGTTRLGRGREDSLMNPRGTSWTPSPCRDCDDE
jgi:hypothetical protein